MLLEQALVPSPYVELTSLCPLCGSVSDMGVPTSADLVSSDPAYMVTSFNTGHIGLFNMETQQLVLKFESAGPPGVTRDPHQQVLDISEKFQEFRK